MVLMNLRHLGVALLTVFVLALGPAGAETIYEQGPMSGTYGYYDIAQHEISNPFVPAIDAQLTSAKIGLWIHNVLVPWKVNWSIGTAPFASDISSGTAEFSENAYLRSTQSKDVYSSSFGISGKVTSGVTYWLTLGYAWGKYESNGQAAYAMESGSFGWDNVNCCGHLTALQRGPEMMPHSAEWNTFLLYGSRFDDVLPGHWAYDYIEALAASGITAGCGGGNYCPSTPVTRAQMAVFLERGMHGSSFVPPPAKGNVFLDVAAGAFAANFIEQLYLDGITAGCGGNKYCPAGLIGRAEMAVFLLRAKHGSGYRPPAATGMFSDVALSHWAVHWIEQLARERITGGCGSDKYCPSAVVTRDQMAVFLVRTFGL